MRSALLLALLACGESEAGGAAQPPLPTVSLTVGDVTVVAEVADEPDERAAGLMYRESLDDDHGMIFVYPDERPRSFWMKNTPLPLSIAYLSAAGRVVSIKDMEPLSTRPVLSDYGAQYALEMERGWFARHGVTAGAKVTGLPPASAR